MIALLRILRVAAERSILYLRISRGKPPFSLAEELAKDGLGGGDRRS
jgi:hypothetical protein